MFILNYSGSSSLCWSLYTWNVIVEVREAPQESWSLPMHSALSNNVNMPIAYKLG